MVLVSRHDTSPLGCRVLWHGMALSESFSVVPRPESGYSGTTRHGTAVTPCLTVPYLTVSCRTVLVACSASDARLENYTQQARKNMDRTSAMPKLAPFALLHGRLTGFVWLDRTSTLRSRLLARPVPLKFHGARRPRARGTRPRPGPHRAGDARPPCVLPVPAPLDVYGCRRADRIRRRFFLPVSGQGDDYSSFSRWWIGGLAFVLLCASFAVSMAHGCMYYTWTCTTLLRSAVYSGEQRITESERGLRSLQDCRSSFPLFSESCFALLTPPRVPTCGRLWSLTRT